MNANIDQFAHALAVALGITKADALHALAVACRESMADILVVPRAVKRGD